MKTPYLLGIITVLLFGSFAMSGMMAQAGVGGLVMTSVISPGLSIALAGSPATDIATCPPGFQLISGDYLLRDSNGPPGSSVFSYQVFPEPDFLLNEYRLTVSVFGGEGTDVVSVQAIAHCGQLTFPMGMSMVGGIPLDIDTLSLFIGAIGVNPVITGLVAITMGGVAAQAIWYVNSRRVKKVE